MPSEALPRVGREAIRAFLAGKPPMNFSEIATGMRANRESVVNAVCSMFRTGYVRRVSGTGATALYVLNTEKVRSARGEEITITSAGRRPKAAHGRAQTVEEFLAAGGQVQVLELGEVRPKERLRKIGAGNGA